LPWPGLALWFGRARHDRDEFFGKVPQAFARGRIGQDFLGEAVVEQVGEAEQGLTRLRDAITGAFLAKAPRIRMNQREAVDVPARLQEALQAATNHFHASRQVTLESESQFGELGLVVKIHRVAPCGQGLCPLHHRTVRVR